MKKCSRCWVFQCWIQFDRNGKNMLILKKFYKNRRFFSYDSLVLTTLPQRLMNSNTFFALRARISSMNVTRDPADNMKRACVRSAKVFAYLKTYTLTKLTPIPSATNDTNNFQLNVFGCCIAGCFGQMPINAKFFWVVLKTTIFDDFECGVLRSGFSIVVCLIESMVNLNLSCLHWKRLWTD